MCSVALANRINRLLCQEHPTSRTRPGGHCCVTSEDTWFKAACPSSLGHSDGPGASDHLQALPRVYRAQGSANMFTVLPVAQEVSALASLAKAESE